MFMTRIGAKSAAFINHKPFHPGNIQNLEKVWIAEEEHKRELKKQAEFLERRNQEHQIEELKKALRLKEKSENGTAPVYLDGASSSFLGANVSAASRKLHRRKVNNDKLRKATRGSESSGDVISSESQGDPSDLCSSSLYKENVFQWGHCTAWGSYYNRSTNRWGYKCCASCEREKPCHLNQLRNDESSEQQGLSDSGGNETGERKRRISSDSADPAGTSESDELDAAANPKKEKRQRRDALRQDTGLSAILKQLQNE